MRRRRVLGTLALGLATGAAAALAALAGPEPSFQKAVVGKPFQDFVLRDIASGKNIALSSYKGRKIVVAVFMQNNCGTTWRYERKIGDLIRDYKSKDVELVAVHSSFTETDADIKGQIDSRNLPIPILDDKKKQELRAYVGATNTPTFLVIDKEGVLRYRGAFDSQPSAGSTAYVRPALDAILDKRAVTITQTRAFG
ncbi:MAG: redoxin domain-containing protein [Armatimonadota bacterium]